MRSRKVSWRHGLIGLGTLSLLVAVGVVATCPGRIAWIWKPRNPWEHVVTATVRRVDLHASLTASGRVESSNNTVIECELESLAVGVRGQVMASTGASTILSVVAEGTMARQGDLLCQLDSSDYEEMVRQQRISVERAKSDHSQAELNLEVARLSVSEFRDGNMLQDLKQMEGQLALSESECARLKDRMEWARRMLRKGYVSAAQLAGDETALERARFTLAQTRSALDLYRRFTAARTIRILESQVTMAEWTMSYQTQRLERHTGRLATLQRQVERCSIRAPHAGLVIYANVDNRDVRIEPGASVRQKQHLFYLPDLTRMEVDTLLHETVVEQVKNGMRARVTVEGLPDCSLEGHVVSVARLASRDWRNDVPYYRGVIQLDTIPRGLRPGMSAEVKIQAERREDVLTIPPEALTVEEGRNVCYVAHEDGVERREVKLGQATQDLLEVTRGLQEGEEVVLDPDKSDALAERSSRLGSGDGFPDGADSESRTATN